MLKKVTAKAYHGLKVADTLGVMHDLKVLNFTASGSRTMRLDRQCVLDVDTTIVEGMQLLLPDGKTIIVSFKQADMYKNELIRYTIDCIDATHRVNISRSVLAKSDQGGLKSQTDLPVYTNVAAKIGITEVTDSKVIDVSIPKYVMYLSTNYNLLIGDRITISDAAFEVAKVNSLVHVTPGLLEIRFDKDPRWL